MRNIKYLPDDLLDISLNIQQRTDDELSKTTNTIKNKIQFYSVVDSGDFKDAWNVDKKSDLEYSINNTMIYSVPLEEGNIPGTRPWPSVGPKTVLSKGLIWSSSQVHGAHSFVDIDGHLDNMVDNILGDT